MRPLLLAVCLAVVSAGCFGGDDEPTDGGTPTTTTPAGTTTPVTSTPTNPTNSTGGGGTPTTPAPKEICAGSNDFSTMQPDPTTQRAVKAAACGPVAAGYSKLTLNVTWTATGPAVVQNGVAVKLLDSAKAVVATCNGPAPGPAVPPPCTQEGAAMEGEYTLQYEGIGNLQAAVSVMAS